MTDESGAERPTQARTRKVSSFRWTEVSSNTLRKILEYAYRETDQYDQLSRIDRLSDSRLALQAQLTMGQPPKSRFDSAIVEAALKYWLDEAPAKTVKELATLIQAGTSGSSRYDYIGTKSDAITYLLRRKRTRNFVTNVRKYFISAHKIVYEKPSTSTEKIARKGAIVLQGCNSPAALEPYKHQLEAREALSEFYGRSQNGGKGCLVVLPTGSGKTETLVDWLLDKLEQNAETRVLWISHQQELLDQAIQRFSNLASERPDSFTRLARSVHGKASKLASLASRDLDVAAVTFQSLVAAVSGPSAKIIEKFFERPVYIVVDEVHHAGAKSYRKLISKLLEGKPKALIGLTATPAPSSLVNRYHLNQLFPKVVYRATSEELMTRGILSRPILSTVTTNLDVQLDDEELSQAQFGDLSPSALRYMEAGFRDDLIVRTWIHQKERWGKTLVFATGIMHAEALLESFVRSGANARTLHSKSIHRSGVLDWFRKSSDSAVLISVGMLTEGVDLPSARSAFLARPTTSRVLLKQMIGRVLRGPRAGGEATAEVVYFEDSWNNFLDIMGPAEVLPEGFKISSAKKSRGEELLPSVLEDDAGSPIPESVAAAVERQLQQALSNKGEEGDQPPIEASLYSSTMIGYYDMEAYVLPVFEHQKEGFDELLKVLRTRSNLRGLSREAFFEDTHPPYPAGRGLREFTEYFQEFGREPEFRHFEASLGPQAAANAVILAGAVTESERAEIIRQSWEQSLSRTAYLTLARFEEAVEQELRDTRKKKRPFEPEKIKSDPGQGDLPNVPGAERKLKPLLEQTIDVARQVVPQHKLELFLTDLPPVKWTSKVVGSTFGHWSIKLSGKNSGQQIVRINRLLRAPRHVVPDEVICFIIYHELLHHLLPGQGHDAEFRELEFLYPNAEEQMAFLYTFHERYNLDAKRYRR